MKKVAFLIAIGCSFTAVPSMAQERSRFPGARIEVNAGLDVVSGELRYEDTSFSSGDFAESRSTPGFVYGVTAGYDLRVAEGSYLGIEASYEGSENDRCEEVFGDDEACFGLNHNFAVGPRFGTRASNRALFYAGVAYVNGGADLSYVDEATPLNNFREEVDRDGFRISGGIEHQMVRNLFAKLEYRYSNYKDESVAVSPTDTVTLDFDRHQVVSGFGARF